MSVRPGRLVFVTGTGTEVGKTWVSAGLLRAARTRGWSVAARKPLQSFSAGDRTTDSEVLAQATGEDASVVCHQSLAAPMAPPMAAAALGLTVPGLDELRVWLEESWPAACDLGLVEGAGGVASPLGEGCDCAALARALEPDLVVLVAAADLGVINTVRLSVAALAPLPVAVHLNRFEPADDLHRRNRAWLADVDGLTVTTNVADLLAVCAARAPAD